MVWVILISGGVLIIAIFLITWLGQRMGKKYDVGISASPMAVTPPNEVFERSLKDKRPKLKQQINLIPRKENKRKKG